MAAINTRHLVIKEVSPPHESHAYFLQMAFHDIDMALWKCGDVQEIKKKSVEEAVEFAVAPAIFIIFNIDTATEKNRAGMKARNIIKEIWNHYHGNLSNLHIVGYWMIINLDVRKAMENTAGTLLQGQDMSTISGVWVAVSPGYPGWEEAKENNPLIIGNEKMISEDHTTATSAYISSVAFCWNPVDYELVPAFENHELHMKIFISYTTQ